MDEADPGFQLLVNNDVVTSLNDCNENITDSFEDDENAINTRPLIAIVTVLK